MRRINIMPIALAALAAGVGTNASTIPAPNSDAIVPHAAAGNDYSAPVAPSRGKARPSAYANSAAKKRRRRQKRGW